MAVFPDYAEDVLGRNGGAMPITGTNVAADGTTTLQSVPVFVGGKIDVVATSFTRPSDTTAYAVKEVVGPAVTGNLIFTNAGRVNGGSGYIVKAKLTTDQKTNVAVYRLWLFNAAPTPIADNSPFLLLYADAASRIGYIDFNALTTEDTTNSTGAEGIITVGYSTLPMSFACASADRNLYGILETNTVFTPVSAQNYRIALSFDQN